ncbi:MAG: type II toxin-antitoxin system VapC family toxin [Actinobacteria bacterium]|nr:type II toxin-antitoxin system VapC family toxin [Actinomycetota bacterium]
MKLFVDTSALVALADSGDMNHQRAADFARSLPNAARFVTTDYVLDETITRLRFSIGHSRTVEFREKIMASRLYSIVGVNEEIRRLAWGLFKSYGDKQFSFTDCTSFVIMKALRLEEALTFDRHFLQAGFRVIPTSVSR